jgi:GMP synthase (glutamine-hydrolysing)
MQIAVLQHVGFEDAGIIGKLLIDDGHVLMHCHLYQQEAVPLITDIDAVVVMGGPMSVSDETQFPWLKNEKEFLAAAIAANKPVLGICLGAQLIAEVLGARVYRAAQREIGWFPIDTSEAFLQSAYGEVFAKQFMAFHWHGDTFTLPEGALPIGSSAACACQGFVFSDRVIGLQFHLEMTSTGVAKLAKHCAAELVPTEFVQSAGQLIVDEQRFADMHRRMADLLTCWLDSAVDQTERV